MKYTVKSNETAAQMLFDKVSQFSAVAIAYGECPVIAADRARSALAELLGVKSITFSMNASGELSATLDTDS